MAHQIHVTPALLEIEDFGVTLKGDRTVFKVWSPTSESVRVAVYDTWDQYFRREYNMYCDENQCWILEIDENLDGKYYNFIVTRYGQELEIVDPYAKGAAPNSKRALIIDPSRINPLGWHDHPIPPPVPLGHALLYEAHIRDISMHSESGIQNKGKYLGLTEQNTKTSAGFTTGVAYLKELGITHLHLLPVADFVTVDELNPKEYNWGYDPILYNVPEGSYATDAIDGSKRILELKEAIQALHQEGIRVVLDVVYNHTFHGAKSNFNYLVPNYYYRTNHAGQFTNGSGVGNELATENLMVRKFIIESLKYWLTEYKVDGFRFDLLGVYDKETVKQICRALQDIKSDILLYGEPWTGGACGLPLDQQFLKGAQQGLAISVFNDDYRNALKGDNDGFEEGFITGQTGKERWVAMGLMGSMTYSKQCQSFATAPEEVVNYLSCHDNLCLFDKIAKVESGQSFEKLKDMNRLGLSMLLVSIGIPFFQMGTEFLRTKFGHHNSYNSPDSINQVDWKLREQHDDLVQYLKSILQFRRSQRIFIVNKLTILKRAVKVIETEDNTVVVRVKSPYKSDYGEVLYIHYAGWAEKIFTIEGLKGMRIFSDGIRTEHEYTNMEVLDDNSIKVEGVRSVILVRQRKK